MAFRALVALGANEGDCRATFAGALATIAARGDVRETARSTWRETAPIGGPGEQHVFLNGVCLLETSLSAHALGRLLAETEQLFGRRREGRWGTRTLDLDLLLFDEQVIDAADLTVPHPRMAMRRFVLEPAAEIAAEMRHPLFNCSLGEIWRHVQSTPQHATIVGGSAEEQRRLASAIGARWQAELSRTSVPWTLGCQADEYGTRPASRLVIELTNDLGPTSGKMPNAGVHWRQGLVLAVDARHFGAAATEAALALQGLSE
jgi:2-amino-4-hydroxy-6-hydroxymethyldihydropteridine diphosphokinase